MNNSINKFLAFRPKNRVTFANVILLFLLSLSLVYFFNNSLLRSAFSDLRWVYMFSITIAIVMTAVFSYRKKPIAFILIVCLTTYLLSTIVYGLINGSIHSYEGYSASQILFIHLATPLHIPILLSVVITTSADRFFNYIIAKKRLEEKG